MAVAEGSLLGADTKLPSHSVQSGAVALAAAFLHFFKQRGRLLVC